MIFERGISHPAAHFLIGPACVEPRLRVRVHVYTLKEGQQWKKSYHGSPSALTTSPCLGPLLPYLLPTKQPRPTST